MLTACAGRRLQQDAAKWSKGEADEGKEPD